MGLNTNTRCPECGTRAQVTTANKDGLVDSLVKATSEEVVMEICCKEDECSCVWRAVYTFSGNQ